MTTIKLSRGQHDLMVELAERLEQKLPITRQAFPPVTKQAFYTLAKKLGIEADPLTVAKFAHERGYHNEIYYYMVEEGDALYPTPARTPLLPPKEKQ